MKPDATKNKHFQNFRKLTALGEKPSFGPVLLIQGLADDTIPNRMTDKLRDRMKQQEAKVEYKTYRELDHDPLVFGSFRDQLR